MTQLPAWLQALAAILQVGFAYAIYRITKEYVIATKQIAMSTAAQVELLRASSSTDQGKKEASLELQQHLTAIRDFLTGIPSPTARQNADHLARTVVLIPDVHLDGILSTGRKIGAAAAETATRLAQSVRWLRERLRTVQQTNPNLGFDWSRFDWDQWTSRYLDASLALDALLSDRATQEALQGDAPRS